MMSWYEPYGSYRSARAWNLTAPAVLRVREVAELLGELLERVPRFTGEESETALLNNPARLCTELADASAMSLAY